MDLTEQQSLHPVPVAVTKTGGSSRERLGWREPPGKLQVGSLGTSSSEQTPGFALPSAAGQAEMVKYQGKNGWVWGGVTGVFRSVSSQILLSLLAKCVL